MPQTSHSSQRAIVSNSYRQSWPMALILMLLVGVITSYPSAHAAPSAAATTAGIYYPLLDTQGSLRAMTDSSGVVKLRQSYDPWGHVRARTGPANLTTLGWAGERVGTADGLIWLRARHYAPALGRFLQRDSFAGDPTNPQSLNRYAGLEGNPINLLDPSGHGAGPIRQYQASDQAAVKRFLAEAQRVNGEASLNRYWQEVLKRSPGSIHIACADAKCKRILGMVSVFHEARVPATGRQGSYVAFLETLRSPKGTGTALMQHAWSGRARPNDVLYLFAKPEAQGFYTKLGGTPDPDDFGTMIFERQPARPTAAEPRVPATGSRIVSRGISVLNFANKWLGIVGTGLTYYEVAAILYKCSRGECNGPLTNIEFYRKAREERIQNARPKDCIKRGGIYICP